MAHRLGTSRSNASRLVQLRTDATGNSPWCILDDRVRWWQVLGTLSGSGNSYTIQLRIAQTTQVYVAQIVALNAFRSDLFAGCPDLQVRIAGAVQNQTYLLACQGDDLED